MTKPILLISLCLSFILISLHIKAQSGNPFTTIWIPNDDTITIPTYPNITYNYDINWENLTTSGAGDGSDTNVSGPKTINGLTAGDTYKVEITGTFPRIYFHNSSIYHVAGKSDEIFEISQWGDIQWTSFRYAYAGCENMIISATDVPDLTGVTDMSQAFAECSNLIADISINSWDVSTVTNMRWMFKDASSFNRNIGGWDVSHVTDMANMLYGATSFNQDISNWTVSNVTNMRWMFSNATAFNQPIGSWDVSAVTDMSAMFKDASAFNQNISSWIVSNVTEMRYMFNNATAFNQPIGSWDVSAVTDMTAMFWNASAFNQDISVWVVSNVTDMSYMFDGASNFNKPLNGWVVSNVDSMKYMFNAASSFNQNLSNWDVGSVINMFSMFEAASAFNQDISGWNVVNVEDMSYMFINADAFDQNLGSWNLSNLTTAIGMFNASSGQGMSCENMGKTLKGWATKPNTASGVTIGVQSREIPPNYQTYVNTLTNAPYNWTFNPAAPLPECAPLPIELLKFQGKCENGNVELSWVTSTEINNDFFTLERSIDGNNWDFVTTIDGAGTSTTTQEYSYYDNPFGILNSNRSFYYRLKQTDIDGAYTYSDVVLVSCNGEESQFLQVFPNPTTGSFVVRGLEENSELVLLNANGEKVYTTGTVTNSVKIHLDAPAGMYFLVVNSYTGTVTKKIVIAN